MKSSTNRNSYVMQRGVEMIIRCVEQFCVVRLLADNTLLLAVNGRMLRRIVAELERLCGRRKLKVNVSTNKVIIFERAREQAIDFAMLYTVRPERTSVKSSWEKRPDGGSC